MYVGDCIICAYSNNRIDKVIQYLQEVLEKFDFTNDGNVEKYLGVKVRYVGDNTFELAQPHLIELDFIITFMGINHEKTKSIKTRVSKTSLEK